MELIPLKRSAEFDEVERDLKALFLSLYTQYINPQVEELALYGMPHIGPSSLIERHIAADGLAVLRTTSEDHIRQLFHAWRFRNPQRGTAFLEAYLTALFGHVHTVEQLWCAKAGTYPDDVLSETEVLTGGKDINDYFLTSRLRVDIQTEIVPERILRAALTAVAFRFVLEMRSVRYSSSQVRIGFFSNGVQVVRTTGSSIFHQPPINSAITTGLAILPGGVNLVYSTRPL